jgi:hypothetical protein
MSKCLKTRMDRVQSREKRERKDYKNYKKSLAMKESLKCNFFYDE